MSKERIQRSIVSTIIFGLIFGSILFFIEIPGIEGTSMRIISLIIATLIFFGISHFKFIPWIWNIRKR